MRGGLIEQQRINAMIPPRLGVIVPRDAVAIVRFGFARPIAGIDLSGASLALLRLMFGPLAILRVATERQCTRDGDAHFAVGGDGVDVARCAVGQSIGNSVAINFHVTTVQFDNVRVHGVR